MSKLVRLGQRKKMKFFYNQSKPMELVIGLLLLKLYVNKLVFNVLLNNVVIVG